MKHSIKKAVQNIPILGNIFTKYFRILKYRLINNPILEFYYIISVKISNSTGITRNKRPIPIIVSLTTIPERIDRVYLAIETILKQKLKPDQIILWLSDKDFNDTLLKNKNKYTKYLIAQKKRGLSIRYCKDIRSYTKAIYSIKNYPNAIIVSADDDLYYPKKWLKLLYDSYLINPNYIYCYMARFIKLSKDNRLLPHYKWLAHYDRFTGPSHNIFPYTGHGCLFPPGSLHAEVVNEKVFLKICPHHDDAWFCAMAILNGIKYKRVKSISSHFQSIRNTQSISLRQINIVDGKFDPQVKAIFDKYDLYKFLEKKYI